MKIAIIIGTRPEIIKMAPVIKESINQGIETVLIHSNQHYSYELDAIIFKDLNVPAPKHNLNVGSGLHGQQTARILERVEKVLIDEKPDYVLVHGDVNTALAGALAAKKMFIPIGHVEAGLRSYDQRMPEEVNRVLVDHLCDDCFSPTQEALGNLKKEGISESKIHVVGNTVADVCLTYASQKSQSGPLLKSLKVEDERYFLLTLHRPENTDDPKRLQAIFSALSEIATKEGCPILFPIHPRTVKYLEEYKITLPACFQVIPPIGYLDFLKLIRSTKMIFTDSGGIQEEACILGTKCLTLRENTERPESVEVGANLIAGVKRETIINAYEKMARLPLGWLSPYGDGKAASRIISLVRDHFKSPTTSAGCCEILSEKEKLTPLAPF